MDELDYLKQHWNTAQQFPKIPQNSIRRMLHKSSSSIVRWIFLICIIELLLGVCLAIFIPDDKEEKLPFFEIVYTIVSLLFYGVIFYYIFNFFKQFRNIRNHVDTKTLLSNILATRKHVDNYIKFNIYCIFFCVFLGAIERITTDIMAQKSVGEIILMIMVIIVVSGVLLLIFIPIVKFYYKILYRRLTQKLENNYDELMELENTNSGN